MWTTADPLSGISAMAKVTGFSAAEAAELLSRGEIKEKGILAPEEAFNEDTYRKFIEGLHKKNIKIVEKFNSSGS